MKYYSSEFIFITKIYFMTCCQYNCFSSETSTWELHYLYWQLWIIFFSCNTVQDPSEDQWPIIVSTSLNDHDTELSDSICLFSHSTCT